MTPSQVLLVAVALVVALGVLTTLWIRRRRTGGVLIADPSHGAPQRRDQS